MISILALLVGISATFLGSGLGVIYDEELKEKLVDISNSARLTAQLQGAKQSIVFSKKAKQWQISLSTAQEATEFTVSEEQKKQALQAWDPNAFNEKEPLTLAKGWKLLSLQEDPLYEEQSFHFYPDGQSSGGTLLFQTGENGRVFALALDPLTSRITWQEQK